MRVWVAYVSYERDLGSQILGVRAAPEVAKKLAEAHWKHLCGETDVPAQELSWAEYEGHDGKGLQSVQEMGTYYLEEVELEVIPQGDVREGNISYLDLQVLRLTIETGRLAHQILELSGIRDLHVAREKELRGYINHLITKWVKNPYEKDPGVVTTGYVFSTGELWEVG